MPRELVHPLPLVLASSSASRKKLFDQVGLSFEVVSSNIDEKSITGKAPSERVINIAKAKIEAVAKKYEKPAIFLAADSVVIYNNQVLEKPPFKMTALEMLKKLSGNIHTLLTGWAIHNSYKNVWFTGHSETYVTFRKLGYQEMVDYVNDNPVTTWAGGYNSHLSSAIHFITKIEGSLSGSNGLPLDQIVPIIKNEYAHPYLPRAKK